MAEVKWIKIYTNMISNKKIKRIRTLPEGNNIILIWVFLLAQAGESNKNGALYLTDTLPFRAEDLAVEFDFDLTVINLALATLERFSMIEVFDDIIYIKNWGEYQNIDGLEKIREQTRTRVANYREKQKQLAECNVTSNATVTQGNATDIDKELDKDKYIDEFFKTVWSLYPNKKGVGAVNKKNKVTLYELGLEKVTSCINAYTKYVEAQRKTGFDLKYQNGSTFFNSGYKDYLANVMDKPKQKTSVVVVEGDYLE